jgi:hypothetical protein
MKQNEDGAKQPRAGEGKQDNFSIKCGPLEKAHLQAVMKSKSLTGLDFARLISALLTQSGFSPPLAGDVPEIQALKITLQQHVADYSDKICTCLDRVAEQLSVYKGQSATSATEAASQKVRFEEDVKKLQAELVNSRLAADGHLRENAALRQTVEKSNQVVWLLQRENQDKGAEIRHLRDRLDALLNNRFAGLEEDMPAIERKIGVPTSEGT